MLKPPSPRRTPNEDPRERPHLPEKPVCWSGASKIKGGRWRRRPRPPASASEQPPSGWLDGAQRARPGLGDRSSAPRRRPTELPADRVEAIEALRRLRMTAAEIAECLPMALSTVSRWLRRIGLGKRSRLEPPEPPNRYERKRAGELVHIDVKKLGRILAPRAPGPWRPAFARSIKSQAAAPGGRRLGVRPRLRRRRHPPRLRRGARRREGRDRRRLSRRAVVWFTWMGITVERVMTDNGSCYRSKVHAEACRELGCATSSPGPTGLEPTARPSASSRPSPTAGPTGHLRLLGGAHRGSGRLARPLQLHPTSWLPRPQGARGSARRAGTTS